MRIEIRTDSGTVTATAVEDQEIVIAKGGTLTEALENLMRRFSELRAAALRELLAKEFVRDAVSDKEMS